MEKRDAEKTKATMPNDGLSESYRPKELLLRGARESYAATLRELHARLRSAREIWQRMAQDS